MTAYLPLERLEYEVSRLSIRDQLRLILRIVERLSAIPWDTESRDAKEADELLALCDAAAEMWNGTFDAASEIRQIRHQRDEQVWPTGS
ncbi:MAG: hypothetical protein ACK4WK_03220 [Anaerolineae bacterium]